MLQVSICGNNDNNSKSIYLNNSKYIDLEFTKKLLIIINKQKPYLLRKNICSIIQEKSVT